VVCVDAFMGGVDCTGASLPEDHVTGKRGFDLARRAGLEEIRSRDALILEPSLDLEEVLAISSFFDLSLDPVPVRLVGGKFLDNGQEAEFECRVADDLCAKVSDRPADEAALLSGFEALDAHEVLLVSNFEFLDPDIQIVENCWNTGCHEGQYTILVRLRKSVKRGCWLADPVSIDRGAGRWEVRVDRIQKAVTTVMRSQAARRVTLVILALGSVSAFVWGRSYLLQVAAVCGLSMVIWVASEDVATWWDLPVGPWTLATIVREAAGPVAIVILTLAVYWPLVGGHMPWIGDHPVHEFKAYVLADHLLPSGRIMGWTNLSGAGYPAEQMYPILGDLWMASVRYLTFKSLSWEATYAYGLLAVLLFCNLVPYYVGRRFFGPIAGLVAALVVMTDMGGFREGGWVFTMQFGVWPMALGLSLGMLSVERLVHLADRPGVAGVASFAVWTSLGVLAHPIVLLVMFVAVPIFGLYQHVVHGWRGVWAKSIAGLALGLGLVAFWLMPYLLRAGQYSAHVSNLWKAMPQIGEGLLQASLYDHARPWVVVLGTLGLAVAWLEGRPKGTFLALLGLALLFVASITVYAGTGVERWLPVVQHIQFERFVIVVKFLLALGTGFVVARLFFGLGKHVDGGGTVSLRRPMRASGWRRRLVGLLAAAAVAPFIVPVVWAWISRRVVPLRQFETRQDGVAFYKDMVKLSRRVVQESNNDPKGFFRVAYWTGFNDHRLANASIMTGLPQVQCSFIPGETYRYLAHPQPADVPNDRRDFDALSVRYIMANRPLPPSVGPTRLVERSGGLSLYERPGFESRLVTVIGPGKARVVRFDDETIAIKVTEAGAGTRLILHVSVFADWTARQGGRTLTISKNDSLAPHVKGLMEVPVTNGMVVFRYRHKAVDILAKLISILSLGIALFLWGVVRRRGFATRSWSAIIGWVTGHRLVAWVWTGLLLLAPVFLVAKWATAPQLPKQGRSLAWDLARATVFVDYHGTRKPCRWFVDGRFVCGPKPHQYVGPFAEEWGLLNRKGLWAHPYRDGILVIEYPKTLMGRTLALDWGLASSSVGGRAAVVMRVYLAGHKVAEVRRRAVGWAPTKKVDTRLWAGRRISVRFEIETNDISARHFCFDATVLP